MSECEEIATTINRLVKAGCIAKAQELLELSLDDYFVLQLAMFADKKVNAYTTIAAWKQAGLRLPAEDTAEFYPYGDSPMTQNTDTKQDRAVKPGDFCRFEPNMKSVGSWRLEKGMIDLAAGDIVKVVGPAGEELKDRMCYVNKPGKCPVLVTMELVDTEWLELVNGKFKECEYCGAIEHETSDCPYRGKVPYGRKGDFSWRIEDGKTIFE